MGQGDDAPASIPLILGGGGASPRGERGGASGSGGVSPSRGKIPVLQIALVASVT